MGGKYIERRREMSRDTTIVLRPDIKRGNKCVSCPDCGWIYFQVVQRQDQMLICMMCGVPVVSKRE